MQILLLLLFLADAAIHLCASWPPEKRKMRAVSKSVLIPLLIGWYVHSTPAPSAYIIAGLICGFVGDVFLIFPHRTVTFGIGLISFAAGHIVYGIYYTQFITPLPMLSKICVGVVACTYLVYIVGVFRMLFSRMPKLFIVPVLFYMAVLSFMSFSSFLAYVSTKSPMLLVAYIGTVLFIISDTALSLDTFRKRFAMRHMVVMSTYIPAQLLIAVSAATLGGI